MDTLEVLDKTPDVHDQESPGDEEAFQLQLKKQRQLRDYREEGWFHWVRLGALIFISLAAFAIVGSYTYHLVTAESMHWLTPAQVANIKDLSITIITGAIISQTTAYFLHK